MEDVRCARRQQCGPDAALGRHERGPGAREGGPLAIFQGHVLEAMAAHGGSFAQTLLCRHPGQRPADADGLVDARLCRQRCPESRQERGNATGVTHPGPCRLGIQDGSEVDLGDLQAIFPGMGAAGTATTKQLHRSRLAHGLADAAALRGQGRDAGWQPLVDPVSERGDGLDAHGQRLRGISGQALQEVAGVRPRHEASDLGEVAPRTR